MTIRQAIKTIFDANSGLQGAGFGELRANRAKKSKAFPWAVIDSVSDSRTEVSVQSVYEQATVVIVLYGTTLELCEQYTGLFMAAFPDSVQLNLGDGGHISMTIQSHYETEDQISPGTFNSYLSCQVKHRRPKL